MKKFVGLFVLLIILIGCGKEEDDSVTFPHKLHIKSINEKQKIRLFIGSEEIFDATTISKFTSKSEFFTDDWSKVDPSVQMTFLNTDTAQFSSDPNSVKYGIVKNEDLFLFYSPLMVKVIEGTGMIKYTADIVQTPSGNLTKEVRVGYGTYKNLKLSAMRYLFLKGDDHGIQEMISGIIYNEFNPSFVSKLYQTDTLAVQEFEIIMQ